KDGRPPTFDAGAYRNRNVVERSFAYVKQWRGLATRYDKLAITLNRPGSGGGSESTGG
ncbi:transposase, partial [Kocuria sp. NBRC 114282]|uniref:transposase n=1 Tax=Kocuria sp. NBRC 114282 TaxID=2994520 RepID=UPI002555C703